MKVEIATTLTPAIVDAVVGLTAQLSRSAAPPTTEELGEVVASPATDLFIALDDAGTIIGTATLVTFRIPTGRRAWIEDVVVDEAGRGHGVGMALTEAMIARAEELGCRTIDLTSRPSRQAANALYRKAGFEQRDTHVYRYAPGGGG